MSDSDPQNDWRADFRAAEDHALEASLAVSASERLRWLEEAIAFAAKMGALPLPDESSD